MRFHRMLRHPNICQFYYVYEDSRYISIVMEFRPEGSLYDRICEKGHLSEHDACLLIRKLLEVLMYLHDRGLVHRDIKPDNILMHSKDNDYDIQLTDFGL